MQEENRNSLKEDIRIGNALISSRALGVIENWQNTDGLDESILEGRIQDLEQILDFIIASGSGKELTDSERISLLHMIRELHHELKSFL